VAYRLWVGGQVEAAVRRTRFENLHVYRLAEKLADEIWAIASRWHLFARDTMGR